VTKRTIALALVLTLTLPAYGGFSEVAKAISRERGVNRVWIPFLGLARFAVNIVRPQGVHDFQLATFEGASRLDPRQVHAIMRARAGEGFTPLVQAFSKRSGEWSFIYAKPSANGKRLELMILAHDREETVLVSVDVDVQKVARVIHAHPRDVREVASR
jgi:hypothetical protein